ASRTALESPSVRIEFLRSYASRKRFHSARSATLSPLKSQLFEPCPTSARTSLALPARTASTSALTASCGVANDFCVAALPAAADAVAAATCVAGAASATPAAAIAAAIHLVVFMPALAEVA